MPKCKVGDVVMYVGKSVCGNEGKIMTCLKFLPNQPFNDKFSGRKWNSDAWVTDHTFTNRSGNPQNIFQDCNLKPLRGDLLKDEEVTDKELENAH